MKDSLLRWAPRCTESVQQLLGFIDSTFATCPPIQLLSVSRRRLLTASMDPKRPFLPFGAAQNALHRLIQDILSHMANIAPLGSA